MKSESPKSHQLPTRSNERGQVIVLVLLVLSLFLLAAVAFAVDITNMWFHRQAAQGAADAACTAGTMDMFILSQGGTPPSPNFTPGTNFDCAGASPTPVPCWYAATNGYSSPGLTTGAESNDVQGSFPSSVPGVPTLTAVTYPYLRVDVVDRVKVFFIGLLAGSRTQDVRAFAMCGLALQTIPLSPFVVLKPTGSGTLSLGGNTGLAVYGGPKIGIQVNSSSATAVSGGHSGSLDLSLGGIAFTGSNLGVVGGPSSTPGSFNGGTTGQWISPSSLASDPLAQLAAPFQPGPPPAPNPKTVGAGVDGCPETGSNTCSEYSGGDYPTGISVNGTAIFNPGVYYLDTNGFSMGANSCVRPSTATGDGSGGTMFYFANAASLSSGANAGKNCPATPFATSGAKCPGGPPLPTNLPPTLSGSVLLAPCSGPYGDPDGALRGILFFQNRSVSASPNFSGGGGLLFGGVLYFHQCHTTGGSDTGGTNCSSSAYNDILSLGGNAGSSAYVLGNMLVDQLSLSGTSSVTMDLTPNNSYRVVKASLLR